MLKSDLKLDWCSFPAAKFACQHWHYSGTIPRGRLVKIGVYERGTFIGCIIFSPGANNHLGNIIGLSQTECCELTRVALRSHSSQVSRMVAIAIRMLRQNSPGLRAIISFADPDQGHNGAIYQAGNWIYTGITRPQRECMIGGQIIHKRVIGRRFGSIKGIPRGPLKWKYRYIMPLDEEIRKRVEMMQKPYPKREQCAGSKANVAPCAQRGEGGVIPTPALQVCHG